MDALLTPKALVGGVTLALTGIGLRAWQLSNRTTVKLQWTHTGDGRFALVLHNSDSEEGIFVHSVQVDDTIGLQRKLHWAHPLMPKLEYDDGMDGVICRPVAKWNLFKSVTDIEAFSNVFYSRSWSIVVDYQPISPLLPRIMCPRHQAVFVCHPPEKEGQVPTFHAIPRP